MLDALLDRQSARGRRSLWTSAQSGLALGNAIVAVALLAGCADAPVHGAAPPAEVSTGDDARARPATEGAATGDVGTDGAARPSNAQATPAPEAAPTPVLGHDSTASPARRAALGAGQVQVQLRGCLATHEEGSASASTRSAAGENVSLRVHGAQLHVEHNLSHPCCKQATVEREQRGDQVRIIETLSGPTCRCRCASSIETRIGLVPGRYDVSVIVVSDGQTRSAHRETIEVSALRQGQVTDHVAGDDNVGSAPQ